jgi:hypothetical protein
MLVKVCVVAPAASTGNFLPRCLSSFLDDLIFFTALLSAALILFSCSESLATSSDKYSSTVFHPPSDLSAIRINLNRPRKKINNVAKNDQRKQPERPHKLSHNGGGSISSHSYQIQPFRAAGAGAPAPNISKVNDSCHNC